MLAAVFFAAALNTALSAPVAPPVDDFESPLFTIFGRDISACLNIARYRTLQDILWSCLATIFACTWIAVHPNVPEPHHSGWTNMKQRLMIMVYATLAPECITMWALRQRLGAARHAKNYNRKFYPGMEPTTYSIFWYIKDWFLDRTDEEHDGLWSVTHGFLLEMRGLVEDAGEIIREVDRIGKRLDIAEEEINDKSKGDFLTKLLVVSQTTWFIFQCIARWISRLPVTQLEIITLAFAFLNVITYALWWYKPQNIYVPIPVRRYIKAARPPTMERLPIKYGAGAVKPEGGNISDRVLEPKERAQHGEQTSLLEPGQSETPPPFRTSWKDCWDALNVGELLANLIATLRNPQKWKQFGLKWLRLISKPIEPLMVMMDGGGGAVMSKTFYSSGRGFDNWKASCSIGVIAVVFGGLHLIPAWSTFPSSQEKVLWQLSALWITIEPPLLLCASLILQMDIDDFEGNFLFRLRLSMFSIVLIGGLLYVFARFVLVLVAFTTLRGLPQDAYRGVEWTTFLPHL